MRSSMRGAPQRIHVPDLNAILKASMHVLTQDWSKHWKIQEILILWQKEQMRRPLKYSNSISLPSLPKNIYITTILD